MNDTTVFKPDGEDVRLLIAHATVDYIGAEMVSDLTDTLHDDVRIVTERAVTSYGGLLMLVRSAPVFNTFLLLAHGEQLTNCAWLYDLTNSTFCFDNGEQDHHRLRLNVQSLAQALMLRVSNALCLFGVCHFGTDDLAALVCERTCAPACIAPQPGRMITRSAIVRGYSALINKMQEHEHVSLDVQNLHDVLVPAIPYDVRAGLSVYPGQEKWSNTTTLM